MSKYQAIDIARWFIKRSLISNVSEGGEKLSLLKLNKLLYYAEGTSLALGNGSLFDEDILAWQHGAVIREVWNQYVVSPYDLPFGTNEDYVSVSRISKSDQEILETVYETFGQYSEWKLSQIALNESVWKDASNNGENLNRSMPRSEIKKYFKEHYIADAV